MQPFFFPWESTRWREQEESWLDDMAYLMEGEYFTQHTQSPCTWTGEGKERGRGRGEYYMYMQS